MTKSVRVGGVPEHFNLPWILAIEEGAFDRLGVDVEWVEQAGGTGQIMSSLEDGQLDMATPITEGAVTSIAGGNPSRIVRLWVESPLLWGVHVAASGEATTLSDIADGRFAISRFGSGSELMSRVLAEDNGWDLDERRWVVVDDLPGALDALPGGDAEIFLWSKSMTQPHVDSGVLKRIEVFPTPWPSFAVVAGPLLSTAHAALTDTVSDIALARAARLAADPDAADIVVDRYGLARQDAIEWLDQVKWAAPGSKVDVEMLRRVIARMHRLGRIDELVDPADLAFNPS